MKKTLIAMAVASVVAAPMVAVADGPTVYGSLRVALESNGDTLDVRDSATRWGIKGSNDLGNGLSAIYKLEQAVAADKAGFSTNNRLSYAGISGSFGAIVLGRQWTPFYNHAVAASDIFGTYDLLGVRSTFRASNALAYALPSGMPVSGAIALVIDGEADADGVTDDDDVDAINAGFSFGAGPMKVGVGYHKGANDDDPALALSVGGSFGAGSITALIEDLGDTNPWSITGKFGGFRLGYGDNDADDNTIALGYDHKLGDKATLRLTAVKADSADDPKLQAQVKVDF